jgi:hypothetical protein
MSAENEQDQWIESMIAFQCRAPGYLIVERLKAELVQRFQAENIRANWSVAGGIDLCVGMVTCGADWRLAAATVRAELKARGFPMAEVFWLDVAEKIFRPLNPQTSRQMTFEDFRATIDRQLNESKRIADEVRELKRTTDALLEAVREMRQFPSE